MDKKLLKYWKNCLLDAERKSRSLKKEARVTLRIGDKVPEFILRKDIPLLFPKEKQKENDEKRKIQIAPCVFLPEYENGWTSKQNVPEYPFLITATLLPDGTFQVCDNKSERIPVFVRKFLAPNARNDRTIASLSNVDRLLSEFDTEETDWKKYWNACETLFRDATDLTFREMNYADKPEIIVVKAPGRGMAQKIINLYDKLLESKSSHPLLELLIRKRQERLLPVPDKQQVYCNRSHWAQMSGEFPLSVSQRETLAMYTEPDCSDIFAVNGPPGTGKTTFLQTVIANRIVHTVLDHPDDPDIIVASSANNQAITNILKDFKIEQPAEGKPVNPLSLRWLPGLDTLGLYLSGKDEQKDQYKMMFNTKGDGFPNEYDDPARLEEYRRFYLEHFNRFFRTACRDEVACQRFLRRQMKKIRDKIETCLDVACFKQYGKDMGDKGFLSRLLRKFQKLPSYEEVISGWEQTKDFKKRYDTLTANPEYSALPYTEDMAVRLDISYRYLLFWYAIHDREAEFIRRLAECDKEEETRGREDYTERLKRLACVMPVFISTFHSLPKYMVCVDNGEWDAPLYDSIDLLIVDESGQVSPELAIPSFSLARQAILVGDVEQIEPIWSISDEYSCINLQCFGLISSESDKRYAFLHENGFLSSSGSIMKMARKSCSFEVAGERGAFLTEHRRCVDPIIAYCNDYVYHGRLLPKKGNKVKYKDLPPKGYVHVNGVSEKGETGSVLNKAEAAAIVSWLEKEKDKLESVYKDPVCKIVAIVTPFKAQEEIIRHLAKQSPEAEAFAGMTIGTVHSLQGAQCPVVIFSSVNSPGDASYFMEQGGKYNMLNVAVSRAQYHFLVFGNMNIFHSERNTPVGNLAKWLFDDPANEVSGNFIYRQKEPLCRYQPAERLSTLEAHTGLLQQAFKESAKRLLIVSPFISIRAIEHDNLLPQMREAVERGVEVVVYSDSRLDYNGQTGSLREEADAGRKALVENGIKLILLKGIHNKSLAIDDSVLVEGSFNWLSASRDEAYSRHECSVKLLSPEAAKHISNLMKELDAIEPESVFFKPVPVSVPKRLPVENKICPGFFDADPVNTCTDEDIAGFKQRIRQLGIQKTDVSESIMKVRKQSPRHYEPWSDEECRILQELMQKTNDLNIFCSCLQRTPRSIRIKVEGMDQD